MNKQVCYGDQVYIEISNLLPPPNTDTRLLFSNGFLEDKLFGVKAGDFSKTNFRSCVFTVLPSLVDSKEDLNILRSLGAELSFLSASRPSAFGEKYLQNEIKYKEEQVNLTKEALSALNKKILKEMDNSQVCYGDIVLLQHLESGYYLCADGSNHPQNSSLSNVRLQKERASACYFQFFSYTVTSDRGPIDYEGEMRLLSIHLGTITMSQNRVRELLDLTSEDDETQVVNNPTFPADAIRRENTIKSFSAEPLIIGTTLDSQDNNKIRLARYCTRSESLNFNKRKAIKNGDYIRLQLEDFYLTASKSIYRQNFGLYNHNTEGYRYNNINSIFQVIKIGEEEEYPRGSEIQSNAKKMEDENDVDRYYLKHLVTGQYLTVPGNELYQQLEAENDEMAEKPTEIPSFCLINNNSKNQKAPLTRNSKILLKAFEYKNSEGQFFLEAQLEKYQILQFEINSVYFVGFNHPEDKIKDKLKLVKKFISGNQGVGSFFKVDLVSTSELRKILEFESYANALKNFMRCLQSIFRYNEKVTHDDFATELIKMLKHSQNLIALISSDDSQVQILAREFRILDITIRFLYYFLVSHEIATVFENQKCEIGPAVKLVQNFTKIILDTARSNDLTLNYVTQYVRIFTNALFSPSAFVTQCNKDQTKVLKDCTVELLCKLLWEKDSDTFGQLTYYEANYFKSLEAHSDYSTHLLELMAHYCSCKIPNHENSIRANFVLNYLSDPTKLSKLFPKINPLTSENDFEIEFQREGYDQRIRLSQAPNEVLLYLEWAFKVINSVALNPSLQFFKIIIGYYSEHLCEEIVNSRRVNAKIRNQVLQTLRLVHFAYNKLPFDTLPPKIQIMLSEEKVRQYNDQFHHIIHEAKHHLISKWELGEMETMKNNPCHAKRISIEHLSLHILNEEFQRIKTGDLQGLAFTLQIMDNLVNDQENLSNENLYIVYHSLAFITLKASQELAIKKPGTFYGPFAENASKIFSVLSRIDDHVVHMAFQQSINDIKQKVLKIRSSAVPSQSLIAKSQLAIVSASFASLEGEIMNAVKENLAADWKSKEKLYNFGGKHAENEEKITDNKLMEALWKIVESDDLSLTTAAVHLIKNKSNFECNLTKELVDSALFVDDAEVSQFMELITSLLNINQIGRRIQAIKEFKLPHREDNKTLDELIINLQQILLTIYDYKLHLQEENANLTEEDAKSTFLKRFEYSKTEAASEIPFRYKHDCVKVFYQRVMNVLKAPHILVPFIKRLTFQEEFQDLDSKKLKHAIALFMNIVVLFEYKNVANQNYLASYNEFVTSFYKPQVLNISPEAINMFTELCRDNKKLLKVSDDWLFKVFAYTFIGYINPFTVAYRPANAGSALPINYTRSIPVLFTSEIPKDMFDPVEIMTSKLRDFYSFMNNDDRISIETLLSKTSDGMADSASLKELIFSTSPDHAEKIILDMPIYYTILKEFLLANAAFSLTRASSAIKEALSLERVIPFITNQNIEFNFALKQLTLQAFENAYFKNSTGNVLLDQSELGSLTSLLLVDVFGYLKNRLKPSDPIFDYLNTEYFSLAETRCYIEKYDNILLKANLDKVIFLEYQSLVQFKTVWKDYIYYIMSSIFVNLINHFKEFMTCTHEREKNEKSTFEIWLDLIIKLRAIDHDAKDSAIIDYALKHAIIHPEYAEYHKKIYAVLGDSSKILNVNTINVTATPSSSDVHWRPDLQTLIEKYFGDKENFKHRYRNANLKQTVAILTSNTLVLKKLIRELTIPETPIKDTLFILKLLRNFIEIGNQTEANNDQPMYRWVDVSSQEFKKIRKNQNILNDLNLVEAVFDLLSQSKQNSKVFIETLSLCIALLYGGNSDVQNSFYEQFKQDYDNEVIETLARILESSVENFRKIESLKTKKAYSKALRYVYDYFLDKSDEKIAVSGDLIEIPDNLKHEINQKYIMKRNQEFILSENDLRNRTLLLNILKFFQSLCEGHYLNFQEFLRDQTLAEHSRSTNIPEFLRQAYHSYYKEINVENVEIGTRIISLLIELEQGESQPNVNLLLRKTFISDMCNTLTGFNSDLDLLSRGFGFNADNSEFMELKSRALVVLKDLVERAEPADMKEIKQYINLRSLVATFKQNLISFHNQIGHYPEQIHLEADHIWNSNLSSAFMIYFILRHISLGETTEDFSQEIKDTFDEILSNNRGISQSLANKYLNVFFKHYTGSIEVLKVKSQKLMTIYFPISVLYTYLKKDTKIEFENKVDRSNTQTKIADLMDNSDELIEQANVEYQSKNKFLGFNFSLLYNWLRFLTNILALTVIVFNIFQLIYVDKDIGVEYRSNGSDTAQIVINIVQSVIAALLVLLWLQTRCRRYLAFKWNEIVTDHVKEQGHLPQYMLHKIEIGEIDAEIAHAVLDLKGPFSEEWDAVKTFAGNTLATHNLIFTLQSPLLLWHIFYLGICIGSSFHPLVTAFQLFDIVVRSDTVNRIALAISRNATQFLWTLILLFTTVYVYSVIGMYFLHERYDDSDVGDLCSDGYSCLLASLNQGLRSGGGIADALQKIVYSPDRKWAYLGHTLFDISFFIIIIIILLNLIFGMIIDAFGELRDEKNSNEDDKKNVCFICGLSRSEYERTSNFDKHITQEHDKWQYLAYIIYLLDKKKRFATDLSDVEDYILSCYLRKDYCWLPVGRSLTFERHFQKGEDDMRSEVDIMKDDIMGAIQLMAEQNKMILSKLSEVYANSNQTKISVAKAPKFKPTISREINLPNVSPERKPTKPLE